MAPRHTENIILLMGQSMKENSITWAISVGMVSFIIQMGTYATLEDGLITPSMDLGSWIMKILQITSNLRTMRISTWIILKLGITTKGNSAWIRKMGSALYSCVMVINSAVASWRIWFRDTGHSPRGKGKEFQEFGTKIY